MGILNEYRIIAQVIWNDWWRPKQGKILAFNFHMQSMLNSSTWTKAKRISKRYKIASTEWVIYSLRSW